ARGPRNPRRPPDEQESRRRVPLEVLAQPPPTEIRARPFAVEVERGADPRCGQPLDEPFLLHAVTMLMPMRGRVAALAAVAAAALASSAEAAPPQGFQSNAAFAASYPAPGRTRPRPAN